MFYHGLSLFPASALAPMRFWPTWTPKAPPPERWWAKWIMIPLETIPLPTDAQPGTQKYLEIFRSSAIVREQAWIHRLKTGFPGGLNIEVHQENLSTRQRRQARRASGKSDNVEFQEVPQKV